MSRIIKCDRCGGEIEPGHIGYVSMLSRDDKGDLCGDNPFEMMDICPSCMASIAEFVQKPTAKEKPAVMRKEKPAAVKPKKKYNKELDVPKIHTLARAGWDDRKIADEMGCSLQTVRKHLRSMEA